MPEQLSFPLPRRRALGREDFFVSPANAAALALVEAPGRWPGGRLAIIGPAGSGKTHLAHVFAAEAGARVIGAQDLAAEGPDRLATAPLALDDAEAADETLFFHLYNLMGAAGHPLLITAARAPALWGLGLADLESRLASVTAVPLLQPDDTLVAAVLAKHFADRQISPPPSLIPWLVTRMERSLDAAGRIVAEIDRMALAEGVPINRALAARILDNRGDRS